MRLRSCVVADRLPDGGGAGVLDVARHAFTAGVQAAAAVSIGVVLVVAAIVAMALRERKGLVRED